MLLISKKHTLWDSPSPFSDLFGGIPISMGEVLEAYVLFNYSGPNLTVQRVKLNTLTISLVIKLQEEKKENRTI